MPTELPIACALNATELPVRLAELGDLGPETQCCGFLTIPVSDDHDAVVLSIAAPEGAEVVLAELVDAFRGEPQAA
jgi:hypothetical protein